MTKTKKQTLIVTILIAIILMADQALKIWVKTHMQIGEEIPLIGSWCKLHFVENVGMAFGVALGGSIGKLLLTSFRILASAGVMWAIVHFIRKGSRSLFIISLALIFVGAVGNLIDSCLYGIIFNESYYSVAQLFPPEGGYAPFLFGRVVDMFYFPIIETTLPNGRPFVFFSAIFNIADAAITIGISLLIIDYIIVENRRKKENATKPTPTDESCDTTTPWHTINNTEPATDSESGDC